MHFSIHSKPSEKQTYACIWVSFLLSLWVSEDQTLVTIESAPDTCWLSEVEWSPSQAAHPKPLGGLQAWQSILAQLQPVCSMHHRWGGFKASPPNQHLHSTLDFANVLDPSLFWFCTEALSYLLDEKAQVLIINMQIKCKRYLTTRYKILRNNSWILII